MVYDVNAFEISDNQEDEAGAAPTTRSQGNNVIFGLETDEWSGSGGSALFSSVQRVANKYSRINVEEWQSG